MDQFSLLGKRQFLPLFCTQFLGALNDNVFKNAIVIMIAFSLADKMAMNSSILVMVASGLFILPFFLFSATAGQIADKTEKSLLIRRVKSAEIIIMCCAGVGFHLESMPILLTVLFFMGAQSTMFGPLKYAILPQHLAGDELLGGNGMIQMGTYMGILLGMIIGGLLISLDAGARYVSILIVVIACMGRLASHWIPLAPAAEPSLRMRWNFIIETRRIIGYAGMDRSVFRSIIGISWFWFCGATFLALVPSYTDDILNADERVATLMLIAFSVGVGTGSMLCEKLLRKRIDFGLMPIGAAGLTLFAGDVAFISPPAALAADADVVLTVSAFLSHCSHWRLLFDLAMIGVCGGLYMAPLYAFIQRRSDPKRCSRIIAANNIMNAFFMVISAVLMSALIALNVTIERLFLIVAVLNVLLMLLLCVKERKIPDDFVRLLRR